MVLAKREAWAFGIALTSIVVMAVAGWTFTNIQLDNAIRSSEQRQCAALAEELTVYEEYSNFLAATGRRLVIAKRDLYEQFDCPPRPAVAPRPSPTPTRSAR